MSTADLERRIIALQHEVTRLTAENEALEKRMAATFEALRDADEAIGRLGSERGGPVLDRAQESIWDAIAAWNGIERRARNGR